MPDSPQTHAPLVGIIMGSHSDWETMQSASAILTELGVPNECRVISAHRTPEALFDYAKTARDRGLKCIIAGAGGAAHLAGVTAAMTSLPILGVPVESKSLRGMDSLLSMVQMPGGIPVGTLAIGPAGAKNAGLLAAAMLANDDPALLRRLDDWRAKQAASILANPIPGL
ncbi:MAG: 5-(carboxyamino)imidazole ribonucleotide mutase [Planctomycetota bacterium]|nr:5-(carboxyamino)imidazole ribonucleotide mutase [Planctomycetota bacterium]MDA1106429.1 5-(carboxyamino)imidazole ribonucleotide mutase [Planctomycetota bacterium]